MIVTFDPGGAGSDDDVYTVWIGSTPYTVDRISAAGGGAGALFSAVRWVSDPQPDTHLVLWDVDAALSDALDFVQLATFSHYGTSGNAELFATIVFGRETAPGDMPVSGTASFTGFGLADYRNESGGRFATRHDIVLSADFSTGAISGGATNFQYNAPVSCGEDCSSFMLVPLPEVGFTFNALIASGTSHFSGTAQSSGLNIAGEIEGTFFGDQGAPPEEAGLAYELGDLAQGPYLAGAAVLQRDPP